MVQEEEQHAENGSGEMSHKADIPGKTYGDIDE